MGEETSLWMSLADLQQETITTVRDQLRYADAHRPAFGRKLWEKYVGIAHEVFDVVRTRDQTGEVDDRFSKLRLCCNALNNCCRALRWDSFGDGMSHKALRIKFEECRGILCGFRNIDQITIEDVAPDVSRAVDAARDHFCENAGWVFGANLTDLTDDFVTNVARSAIFLGVKGAGTSWVGCSSIGSNIVYLNTAVECDEKARKADAAHELSHVLTRAWARSHPLPAGVSILAWNSAQSLSLALSAADYPAEVRDDDRHAFKGQRPVEAGQFYDVKTRIYDWPAISLLPFCMKGRSGEVK
jgi:hypothetical protein